MKIVVSLLFATLLLNFAYAATNVKKESKESDPITKELLSGFAKEYGDNKEIAVFKSKVIGYSGRSVPALITVMKESRFPDKNRWVATFLLGQIMGPKASPYIAKFTKHPNWILRMASLKVLLALKETRFEEEYGWSLRDSSMIVRVQALENIRVLKLTNQAPKVWSMLYDKQNYYNVNTGKLKRTNVVKEAIATIGDLKFEKARGPLLKMAKNKKYNDIFTEVDYSLTKITGKNSPKGSEDNKRIFWSKLATSETITL